MQKTASDSKVRKWDGFKAEKCWSQNKRREEQEKDSATKLSSQAPKGQFLHMVFMFEYVYYGKQKAIFLIKVQESWENLLRCNSSSHPQTDLTVTDSLETLKRNNINIF